MDFDERRVYHPDAGWHRGADADREVDVINPRHIPAGQDRLFDLRALLCCQVHAAARLALLRLTLLSLPLLRSLAWLGLALLRRLTGLALLTLLALRSLAGTLIALLPPLTRLLGLTLFFLHSRFALTLRRLAGGLAALPALATGPAFLPGPAAIGPAFLAGSAAMGPAAARIVGPGRAHPIPPDFLLGANVS
jgi:hypothetical protein